MSRYKICRACGADIMLIQTIPAHRWMVIDPVWLDDDDERGNVAVRRDHLGSLYCRVVSRAEPLRPGERRAVPHFATCAARRPEPPSAAGAGHEPPAADGTNLTAG